MNPPLRYFPAYLGLFAAQVLAMACNAFLDIQYQQFGLEVTLWAIAFGITLALAWVQRGKVTEAGKWGQGCVFALACIVSLTVFIPMWGFPRAGLAMLAALQVVYNCVTVTRRQLHLGLLISEVMVMFAASHYRADWSMLFYLVPYVVAVVLTLVSEQINRRVQDLQAECVSRQVVGGQSAAIAAATISILVIAAVLYVITPQPVRSSLRWQNGVPSSLGTVGKLQLQGGGQSGGGQSISGEGAGEGEATQEWKFSTAWPSPGEMRQSAQRLGMPQWQRTATKKLADGVEWVQLNMKPLMQALAELLQWLKEWLAEHYRAIGYTILAFVLALLAYGLWFLLREAKAGLWIVTRIDYLRFSVFGLHASGGDGARQYYLAMQRLFALHEEPRFATLNAREYLFSLNAGFRHLQRELNVMTRLFEDVYYGPDVFSEEKLERMRYVYREIYREV